MYTLVDYLKWRSDIEMSQDGFNPVDNVVLSSISYLNFDVILNQPNETKSLSTLADEYFSIHKNKKSKNKDLLAGVPEIFSLAAYSKRYENIVIRNYVNHIDKEKVLQFSAMEFVLPDGTSYISFRGTDDTIIGWQEDFLLAVTEVQSEIEAVAYLNYVASLSNNKLRVAGHSKGGHLAIYAAALCTGENQSRILEIYSNDGPGFTKEFVNTYEVGLISEKVTHIIPEDSVVGMIMEPIGKTLVVKSTNKKVMQHDQLSWCVEKNHFVEADSPTKNSMAIHKSTLQWINSFNTDEKIKFINELFEILKAPGYQKMSELQNGGIHAITAMTKQLNHSSAETRDKLKTLLKLLIPEII